ncbi:MAG TPA: hypothetical protein VF391_13325 [Dermatophilaceae bacterium]
MTLIALVAAGLLLLAACAPGPNTLARISTPHPAGFWLGLWQGAISPITFVVSLFNDKVNIYEVHNNGNWYNFGFMIGISAAFSGAARSGAAAGSRRPPKSERRAAKADPSDH